MGNTIVVETVQQGSSPPPDGKDLATDLLRDMEKLSAPRPVLQRKTSSFLEEPNTNKLTERGEADVTLQNDGNDTDMGGAHSISSINGHGRPQLRYAVSEMQGWRAHMEDKHVLNPTLSTNAKQAKLLKDHHLFAVFDGHGGDFASDFCGAHFVETLISQKDWLGYLRLSSAMKRQSVAGVQLLKSALTLAFLELDKKLMKAQRAQRLHQLSLLEDMVSKMGGTMGIDVFQKGTRDHERIINFDKILPESIPAGVPLERSGSTGIVVLVTPHHIICANAGDSRAILSKKNEVLPLSFDHKPSNDVELTRVYKDGGFVRAGRVDGDLAVARSFGDFGYKNCLVNDKSNADAASPDKSILPASQGISTVSTWLSSITSTAEHPKDHRVTVHPDILVHTREPAKDEFVMLACDGVWDRLSNKDCSNLIRSLVREGETDAGLICEEVIDTALELDSRDNMTCLLVVFPGAGMSTTHAGSHRMGVLKRRRNREESWGMDSSPAKRAQQRLNERNRKRREVIAKMAKVSKQKVSTASSGSNDCAPPTAKPSSINFKSSTSDGGSVPSKQASSPSKQDTCIDHKASGHGSSSIAGSTVANSSESNHHKSNGKGKKNKASSQPKNGSARVRNGKSLRIQMNSNEASMGQ